MDNAVFDPSFNSCACTRHRQSSRRSAQMDTIFRVRDSAFGIGKIRLGIVSRGSNGAQKIFNDKFQIRDSSAGLKISVTSVLILMEPDMGTAVAVLFAGITLLFVSGVSLKHLFCIAISALPVMCLAVLMEPYRVRRILAFVNPWADAKGTGFQLVQSFIALGSGGFFGAGLGESRQKLFYLPASHTDFIFSIIGEELGFLGTFAVLTLFALFIWFSLRIAFKLHDTFSSRAVMGIGVIIAFEVIVNVGVSTGMLPTKGLPLPFISYGGSSLISHMAACGLILNLAREAE